jgi:protein-L-isoaspartate(D-aspartate) O-methyltransferase
MKKRAWLVVAALSVIALTCTAACERQPPAQKAKSSGEAVATTREPARAAEPSSLVAARARMVEEQIESRGVRDARVLAAMRAVPRHEFVPEHLRERAHDDRPLRIEAGQTISQPYIVALMTELAQVKPGARVLEVGTGSGYQAAVLAELGAEVYSIEIVRELAETARERLSRLGYRVHLRHGDGYAGWPEHAPFDAIVVTAAPPSIPPPLEAQLTPSGRLVVPVGEGYQKLTVVQRTEQGFSRRSVLPVRFVPMTGKAQDGP